MKRDIIDNFNRSHILLYFLFQRLCIHALTTVIAVPRQNVKKENAFVKEIELETGNTAEVLSINNPDFMCDHGLFK